MAAKMGRRYTLGLFMTLNRLVQSNEQVKKEELAAAHPPLGKEDREEQSHDSGELAVAAALDRRTHNDEDEEKRDGHR
jgi:hypothetical protein